MKIVSSTNASVTEIAAIIPSPVKVCMHILSSVRTEVRAKRAATALAEVGFAVSIFDVEGEGECAQPAEEDIGGVRVKHLIVPKSFITTRFTRWALVRAARLFIRATLKLLRTPADVYHALDLPALPACYLAARLRRKPLIFEAYELPLSTLPLSEMSTSRRWLHALLAPLLGLMVPRCAGVITVAPPIVDELRRSYHIPEVALVRNVPAYREVRKSDRLRQHLGLGPEVRIALYQGYLQPDRSLDRLIRAAVFLERDTVIVMMGKGDGATLSQLEALIASEGVADRVKILPPVPYEELLDWTASADIGLTLFSPAYSLSIRMTLPNKLFEYLMAGLPVLTSSLDAIVAVINTYDVGQVVTSLAPANIGAAINSMLADHEALARMSCNALKAAKDEFYWEKESQELIRLYQNILAAQHAKQ